MFRSTTFEVLSRDLEASVEWLRKLGFRCSHSRLERYLRNLKSLSAAQKEGRIEILRKTHSFPVLLNSIHEAEEIVTIWRGLSGKMGSREAKRFRDIVGGPSWQFEEVVGKGANAKPRDLFFELYVAARLSLGGFEVSFGSQADVMFNFLGAEVFVECKRPHTDSAIPRKISDGFNQLRQRFRIARIPCFARGIVFLSIGKLLSRGTHMLRVQTDEELRATADSMCEQFLELCRPHWNLPPDYRISGIAVVLGVPSVVESVPRITTVENVVLREIGPSPFLRVVGDHFRASQQALEIYSAQ